MSLILLAVAGVVLLLVSLAVQLTGDINERRQRDLGDSEALRGALSNWEPLIFERCKTFRGVKLFANRTRYICALIGNEEQIAICVGFSALIELKVIEQNKQFNNRDDFENCKEIWREQLTSTFSEDMQKHESWKEIQKFFNKAKKEHWEAFAKDSVDVRFPKRPRPEGEISEGSPYDLST